MEENTKKAIKEITPYVLGGIIWFVTMVLVNNLPTHSKSFASTIIASFIVLCMYIGMVDICKHLPYWYIWLDKKIKEIWGRK